MKKYKNNDEVKMIECDYGKEFDYCGLKATIVNDNPTACDYEVKFEDGRMDLVFEIELESISE